MKDIKSELGSDARWKLIERIINSSTFQRSERLRELLRYLAENTLKGATTDLSEQQIGVAVFGKPAGYSIVEDSSVRVHVRQLRLKLHEYFDSEGRLETWVVEIPKGSYTAAFRSAVLQEPPTDTNMSYGQLAMRLLPWTLAAVFLVTTLQAHLQKSAKQSSVLPPWPLSALFDDGHEPIPVVIADANYGLAHLLLGQSLTLQQYLSPAYRSGELLHEKSIKSGSTEIFDYLTRAVLTSSADAKIVLSLAQICGDAGRRLVVRSARNLLPHDFDQGNFVLVGSVLSNPWILYFQHELNFWARENRTGNGTACFENLHPARGEQQSYCSSPLTGGDGVEYATISLLPLPSGQGSALILQGQHQEGVEAAGAFLANAANRKALEQALGKPEGATAPFYFEALIQIDAVAGTPVGTSSLVTVHRFQP